MNLVKEICLTHLTGMNNKAIVILRDTPMKLIKINDQVWINTDHIITVNFLPDKLKTIIVCKDRVIIESDKSFQETVNYLNSLEDK